MNGGWWGGDIIYIDKEKTRRILFDVKKKLSEYLHIIKILCIFAM